MTALNRALKWGLVTRNVAALSDQPARTSSKATQYLLPEQADALLKVIEGDRLEALFATALMMGLRIGEVLALRWSDIDFDGRQLSVNHTLQRVKQKGELHSRLTLCDTKTTASQATMTMPAPVIEALRRHRALQMSEGLAPTGHVFTTSIGTPLQDGKVRQKFYALLTTAGLPRIKFHGLRHSCASFLIAKGVPARMVMEWMRHSQISTTMNIYGHIIPTLRQQAVDAMDSMFLRKNV